MGTSSGTRKKSLVQVSFVSSGNLRWVRRLKARIRERERKREKASEDRCKREAGWLEQGLQGDEGEEGNHREGVSSDKKEGSFSFRTGVKRKGDMGRWKLPGGEEQFFH